MSTNPITLRIPAAAANTESGYLKLGEYQAPNRSLTVNSRYLSLDGKPWLPIMGEFHFSRYPASEWEVELRKMQAGGVNIIASYVFWNHHEEVEGEFDWVGQRDLRQFVSLVQKIGLYFYLRPGPWVHAEARNGGFPDWLLTETPVEQRGGAAYQAEEANFFREMMEDGDVRCNAPRYLARVSRFYGEIGAQLKRLMWQDGGPVIGVQLENEYHRIGPGCGAEHIAELKRIAIEAGLRVPLYTVTGWPTLDIPLQEVVPVSGAYPDGFWQNNHSPLPPSGVYVFNPERAIGEMGNVGGTPAEGGINREHYPFFLAEAGGGMHISYHRRPAVGTDDLAATTLVQIGSGANLYGYYMYHGGTNPVGRYGYLNETQGTGYPNDVGLLGYDFHAPLGQYGQQRPSWGRLRTLHSFVAAFGADLAPMEPVLADGATVDATNRTQLRIAARGAGDSAFLFINNHVRHYPMPDFANVQIEVETAQGKLSLPPSAFPSGSYCIWPIGQRLGAAYMHYATVQPLTRWSVDGHTTWVGFSHAHQTAKISFDARSVREIRGTDKLSNEGEALVLTLAPGETPQILKIQDASSQWHTLIVLTQSAADQACRMHFGGKDRLVLSSHGLHQEDDTLVVSAPGSEEAWLKVFPADDLSAPARNADFAHWTFPASDKANALRFTVLSEQRAAPAVQMGPADSPHAAWRGGPVPLMPGDDAFAEATRVAIEVPGALQTDAGRVEIEVDYLGDMARLYADGKLVDDRLFDGETWTIGIDRFASEARWPAFELRILAAPKTLPVFLEEAARKQLAEASNRGEVRAIRARTWKQYRVPATMAAAGVSKQQRTE